MRRSSTPTRPAGQAESAEGFPLHRRQELPYVNVLATKEGKEKDPAIQKLAEALASPEVKKFMEEKYKGAVVPAF